MITKNEAMHLDACLQSVQGLVSEIIIVDTGSTDGTQEIARQYGAQLIETDWLDDFAAMRNIGLSVATAPWILVLDADERCDDWTPEQLRLLMSHDDVAGWSLQLVNFYHLAPEPSYATDAVCRLFRNDPRIRFRGLIHEEVYESIQAEQVGHVPFTDLRILHYGYLPEVIERKHKNERNLSIIQKALQLYPNQLQLSYALGTEYFQQERYEEALRVFVPLLEAIPLDVGYASDLWLKTIYASRETGEYMEARTLVDQALHFFPDFTDLWELQAQLFTAQGDLTAAYEALQQALAIGPAGRRYTTIAGTGTYRTHLSAALVCEQRLDFATAVLHYEAALRYPAAQPIAWLRYVTLLAASERLAELPAFLDGSPTASMSAQCWHNLLPVMLNVRQPEVLLAFIDRFEAKVLQAGIAPSHATLFRVIAALQRGETQGLQVLKEMANNGAAADPLVLQYAVLQQCLMDFTKEEMAQIWQCLEAIGPRWTHAVKTLLSSDIQEHEWNQPIAHSAEWLQCLQMTTQISAWSSLLRLVSNRMQQPEPLPALPLSLVFGLMQAPPHVLQELCHLYNARKARQSSPEHTELLTFAALASAGKVWGLSYLWLREAAAMTTSAVPDAALVSLTAQMAADHDTRAAFPLTYTFPMLLLLS
ncbi:tetratricopeptide repeat-containing glycosyltransferase family 2 protein [Paenibacillus guangzhouensis]|uniref:tetratricopeptide repeat-containing glycosyltransferase family 2 protein n=1 Tax=Paenibacillus guangzhouensis TaxID=1473112 RepID=UPI00187B8BBC|nr:TPR domain-containing glycosyltransferase [Paenibacillus guangzhouensis]